MSLFFDVIKQKGRFGHSEFWNKYSSLNNIDYAENLSPYTLHLVQKSIIGNEMVRNPNLQQANNFINSLEKTYNKDKTGEIVANQIFKRIATILNSPFKSGDTPTRELSNRAEELKNLLTSLNINIPISKTIINTLSKNTILTQENGLYAYRNEKAKLFEEIVAAYFSASNRGKAITTGSWGKISDHNRQLVTDVYAFLNGNSSSMRGKYVSYKKSGYYKTDMQRVSDGIRMSVSSELDGFIKEMEKLNGQSEIGISIDDELADVLDTVSSLRIQVKSGINQSILNRNYRNAISLSEFNNSKLNLLMELFNLDQQQNFIYFYNNQKPSKALTAYANYLLSVNIAKTSLTKDNNIYFTEHGFETVYDWISRQKVLLKFIKDIRLSSQLLSQRRKYDFYKVTQKT